MAVQKITPQDRVNGSAETTEERVLTMLHVALTRQTEATETLAEKLPQEVHALGDQFRADSLSIRNELRDALHSQGRWAFGLAAIAIILLASLVGVQVTANWGSASVSTTHAPEPVHAAP